jgi:hypothetical protein
MPPTYRIWALVCVLVNLSHFWVVCCALWVPYLWAALADRGWFRLSWASPRNALHWLDVIKWVSIRIASRLSGRNINFFCPSDQSSAKWIANDTIPSPSRCFGQRLDSHSHKQTHCSRDAICRWLLVMQRVYAEWFIKCKQVAHMLSRINIVHGEYLFCMFPW